MTASPRTLTFDRGREEARASPHIRRPAARILLKTDVADLIATSI
ncbi:MAG TPA: hypothetical protein VMY16_09675 [Ilumatobacteraceae bacterium]|nr:hypothetical protein [Ilumatobacteraceae bacterium]